MSAGLRIELVACEAIMLSKIANSKITRRFLALTYAMSINSSENDLIDWKKVNALIERRWGFRGLMAVKNRAWRLIEGKEQP